MSLDALTPGPSAPRAGVDRGTTRLAPGLALAGIILCIYGGLAVGVDFPKAKLGIQSDEATYYMMAHSLVEDGDVTYRREDLVRVWREFPGGPSGVFLKKGRDIVDAGLMLRPPFVWTTTQPDTDPGRLFFGKSFIYPLFAAPFVAIFGTNGFLVFHALLLALAAWCSYLFLHARAPAAGAAILAGAFVLATVVPVYYVWIMPELFNFTLGLVAYFCWLYKEVMPAEQMPRGMRWLSRPSSDLAAAVLLGIATFSKVSNALLFPPIALWLVWKRRWARAAAGSAALGLVAGGLFAANVAISGEWNYQGGERSTFYFEFPFQTPASGFATGTEKARDEALTDIIFNRSTFLPNLGRNLLYFVVGRYAGILPYFFPAVFALGALVVMRRQLRSWHYAVLAAAAAQLLFFIVITPYTWLGGGGSVGNRYFMGAYGIFLFLLPPVSRVPVALVPWLVGALFTAPIVLNPFYSSFYPGSYAKQGPLRLLPVELTLVYDWPINTDHGRVRVWFGDNAGQNDPGFQIYFFDDNAYPREADKSFWVKGGSRAEFLIKTDRPMKRLVFTLTAGAVATDVRVTVDGRTQQIRLQPGGVQRMFFALDEGFVYQGTWPVWVASVSSSDGFVPIFVERGSTDTRYLGVNVKPMLVE
ncbi:MAG TPA: hypothetical protein VD833_00615 [Vicinamibacterales bacterium]|nr:hypothetical protein [Vicinamibacterales bacterium]